MRKQKIKLSRFKCARCVSYYKNQKALDKHKEYIHGEVSKERHKKHKSKTGAIYKKYYMNPYNLKVNYRDPPKNEWILGYKDYFEKDGNTIDVRFEWDEEQKTYLMFTDGLIYGNHLEIIYSKEEECFVIKDIIKLREIHYNPLKL